jgi:hypothetical protein
VILQLTDFMGKAKSPYFLTPASVSESVDTVLFAWRALPQAISYELAFFLSEI